MNRGDRVYVTYDRIVRQGQVIEIDLDKGRVKLEIRLTNFQTRKWFPIEALRPAA